ncbi:PREDICTED: pentatricopeptide repeat-containing protein At1g02150-like [Camelina sativa]|uniref:Pentatricopeptide repeat-containing protein At1g02150-like n=1 Tax=Camelina sativa TaxID=90675 RepID=A0ABM0X1R3_CAMSA|nr:PREDICTED: pentatricopeptide repeat-containing protein At1g02150-like [Camelina sativa]
MVLLREHMICTQSLAMKKKTFALLRLIRNLTRERERERMLLQAVQNRNVPLASSASYSGLPRCRSPAISVALSKKTAAIVCSISQVYGYGTVDYERRPIIQWNAIYKKISLMEKPELGAGSVLNQWEKGGRKLTKWELCRVVKELRKYKRPNQALEVYDWMNNRGERFRLSASDAAIQLDLIGKVRGISDAEEFFLTLPENFKDRRVYGSLLNAYVRAKSREKAESLLSTMREKGYALHPLPFNVMMTLYMNLREFDKVDAMVFEMKQKDIRLDIYSYNIWLSSCGSLGSVEKMELVYQQMKSDVAINPNWTTFSTMATMYIKMGETEKAEDALRKVEARITGRNRIPYHYLLSLYGSVGNKKELYRVWHVYKSVAPSVPNLGYHALVSSLVRMGDIEGAEKVYEEWLPVKSSYDPRIPNLLMNAYVKNDQLEKAEGLFDHMVEMGGKPSSSTWEILADGHTRKRCIPEALTCLRKAFSAEGSSNWRPKVLMLSGFFKLCEEESAVTSKEAVLELLRQSGHLQDKSYQALIDVVDENNSENDSHDHESDVLLTQLQDDL